MNGPSVVHFRSTACLYGACFECDLSASIACRKQAGETDVLCSGWNLTEDNYRVLIPKELTPVFY